MIHVEAHHWNIIKSILQKYPYTFYAFGSRTKGTQRKHSDLDICFIEPIPYNIQAHIEEDFTESDLPFKVDVGDFNLMTEEFKTTIKKDLQLLQLGKEEKTIKLR